jgi:TonB family protein
MRILSLFLLVVTFAPLSNAQEERQYYNKEAIPVEDKEHAHYYRELEKQENQWVFTDYYLSGEKKTTGIITDLDKEVYDGPFTSYYKNGAIESTGEFDKGAPIGRFHYFYENGQKKKEVQYLSDEEGRTLQAWNTTGDSLLQAGTGVLEYETDSLLIFEQFQDYKLELSRFTNKSDGSIIYGLTHKKATPLVGFENYLLKHIYKKIKYPREARRKKIEGEVLIEFIVNEDGTLSNYRVIQGVGGGCTEAALEALKNAGKWNPALVNDKSVRTQFVIPIKFSLS